MLWYFSPEIGLNFSFSTAAGSRCCTSAREARRKIESFDCPGGVLVYLISTVCHRVTGIISSSGNPLSPREMKRLLRTLNACFNFD